MIDTADVYSAWVPGHKGGESETLIGEWLKRRGSRDGVLIATKVGMLPCEGGLLEPAGIADSGGGVAGPARGRGDRPLLRPSGRRDRRRSPRR